MRYHKHATWGVYKNSILVYHNQNASIAIEKKYDLVVESNIYCDKIVIRPTHEY